MPPIYFVTFPNIKHQPYHTKPIQMISNSDNYRPLDAVSNKSIINLRRSGAIDTAGASFVIELADCCSGRGEVCALATRDGMVVSEAVVPSLCRLPSSWGRSCSDRG